MRTLPAYQYSALVVLLSTVILALIAGLYEAKHPTVLISPLSAKEYVTVEKVIEKKVFVEPESIEDKIRHAFPENPDLAVRVAKCESGLNPKAVNKTSSARGLFQVMQSWHKIDQKWLFDPTINILVARRLYNESGGSFLPHWSSSSSCWSE